MADPDITAALREATFAGCNATTRGRCVCRRLADEEPCPGDSRHTAAAIEAFLFHAANVHAGCYAAMESRELLKHLAAAVARAAKGGA